MRLSPTFDRKRNWFIWGMVLSWIQPVWLFIGFFNVFGGFSQEKATGLGAVAGGLTETYVTIGLVVTLVLPIVAMVLLIRAWPGGNQIRTVFSLMSICLSAFVLLAYGVGAWWFLAVIPRVTASPH
jgi:hypothetical protein